MILDWCFYLLSVSFAECGWFFFTASPVGQPCCTLCTAGWSPPLCSIIQVWHFFGTTESWKDYWTHWPSPHVLRCAFTPHSELTKSADTVTVYLFTTERRKVGQTTLVSKINKKLKSKWMPGSEELQKIGIISTVKISKGFNKVKNTACFGYM